MMAQCPDINVRAEHAEDPFGVSNEPDRAFGNLSTGIHPRACRIVSDKPEDGLYHPFAATVLICRIRSQAMSNGARFSLRTITAKRGFTAPISLWRTPDHLWQAIRFMSLDITEIWVLFGLMTKEKPALRWSILHKANVGISLHECPDNLIVANSLGKHPQGPFGGNRRASSVIAHNWVGDMRENHAPVSPIIPVVDELPEPETRWHGRLVLLAANDDEIPYICRRESGKLEWMSVGQ
jgi:hypothetical protein